MRQARRNPGFLSTATQRDLAGVMALYEENYIRLRTLVPALARMPERAVSRVQGCVDLHLEIVERARYTTTLRLTCLFPDGAGGRRREPDLTLRICHDARTTEALAVPIAQPGAATNARETLQRCWRRNRFLHKWLGYCLRRGHRFATDRRTTSCDVA